MGKHLSNIVMMETMRIGKDGNPPTLPVSALPKQQQDEQIETLSSDAYDWLPRE
jgi:hypothetical protein